MHKIIQVASRRQVRDARLSLIPGSLLKSLTGLNVRGQRRGSLKDGVYKSLYEY